MDESFLRIIRINYNQAKSKINSEISKGHSIVNSTHEVNITDRKAVEKLQPQQGGPR